MDLKVSVISTAYNGADYVIPFLEGIANQTYRNFEFIIVDDASTDQTAKIIEACLPGLGIPTTFIRHEKNQGVQASAFTAFSNATGDILISIDSDTLIPPNTIADFVETFTNGEKIGGVTAPFVPINRSKWIVRGAEVAFAAQYKNDLKDENDYPQAFGTCFAFRRSILPLKDLLSRGSEADWTWKARKDGWKIVLRKDITVQTRFPDTLPWTFARGRRMAGQVLPSYWHNKEKFLTRWGFWVKFAPLGLLLTALFKPKWAIAGVLGWLGATQLFLARKAPEYPLADRLAAWGVTVIRWSGFDVEVVLLAVRALFNRFRTG